MPDSKLCRSQAAAYLKLAQGCGDDLLADELRALSRSFSQEADRQDKRPPRKAPSAPGRTE